MINRKIFSAAVISAVLLGSNIAAMACSDTTVKCTGEIEIQCVPAPNVAFYIPTMPDIPTIPTMPDIPTIPTMPDIPTVPTMPDIPTVPTIPDIPTVPTIPDIPTVPTMPNIPTVPTMPDIPTVPTMPDIPTVPTMPDIPTVPTIPDIPTTPTIPTIPADLSVKVVDPVNGDIIETTFDPAKQSTTVNMTCPRKDAPDTLTVTSMSGTDTTITADGDTFQCEAGYYGNSVSPVNLTAGYKSSLSITLTNSSVMTGQVNENNKIQNVSLTLDKTSKWVVTGTSHLSVLKNADTTLSNIVDNGNTIYYNASDAANSWLDGKTYTLGGGGKLVPAG